MSDIRIRRIGKGEHQLYREVRLRALADAPDAFCSRLKDAKRRSEESWIEQADASCSGEERATFLVLDEAHTIGLAALYRDEEVTSSGELIQVWLEPAYRGKRLGREVIQQALAWAAEVGIQSVQAEVRNGNPGLIRFYETLGFHLEEAAAGAGTHTRLRLALPDRTR